MDSAADAAPDVINSATASADLEARIVKVLVSGEVREPGEVSLQRLTGTNTELTHVILLFSNKVRVRAFCWTTPILLGWSQLTLRPVHTTRPTTSMLEGFSSPQVG